jgi:predicted nucleotidyltransferase
MGMNIGKYAIPNATVEMRAHINMQGLYFKMRRVGELLALRAAG